MAGQEGQPKYGFGWPDGRLGGLGPPGSTTPVLLYTLKTNLYECVGPLSCIIRRLISNKHVQYSVEWYLSTPCWVFYVQPRVL